MRADALIRRKRILESARKLFSLHGTEVALELVAEHAQVGVGTFYRNFSSREELIKAVALSIMDDIAVAVNRGVQTGVTVKSWTQFLADLARLNLGVFTDTQGLHYDGDIADSQRETLAQVRSLVRQFVDAGIIRPEIEAQDLIVCIAIITRPQPEAIEKAAPQASRQLLDGYLAWTLR